MKLRKGLSLVEIVAVIAIIAIISLAAIARFSNVNEAARVATLESTFNTAVTAVHMHAALTGGQMPENYADIAPHINGVDVADAEDSLHDMFERIGGTINPVELTISFDDGHIRIEAEIAELRNSFEGRAGEYANGTYTLIFDSSAGLDGTPTP